MFFSELIEDQILLFKEGNLEVPVRGIAYDSRQVEPGFLFVAIEGFKTDGHYFIDQAIARGAVALVVQKPVMVSTDIALVQVPDTRLMLALLSDRFYGYPSHKLKLVGVTGTNGKTTTTYLLSAIYRAAGEKVGIIGTIANWIDELMLPVQHTTPESLELQKLLAEMVTEQVQTVVMEVSSHALVLKRVAGCQFDIGVFTNITQDHLDFHRNMEDYLDSKKILFRMLGKGNKSGFAVINADDPHAREIAAACPVEVVTYGMGAGAQVRADSINVSAKGVSFSVHTPWGKSKVSLKLTGLFNVYNALAALATGGNEGLPLSVMVNALQGVSSVRGRFELVEQGQDFTVIVDYAHTPDGLEKVLKTARELTSGKLITVFGCGGDRDRTKRPLMGWVAAKYSDLPVITSDNPRTEDPLKIINDIEEGVRQVRGRNSYEVLPDRREAIAYALCHATCGDVVVIAGKGHENYQIIGTEKFPFDDREEAVKVLKEILGKADC